MGMYVRQERVKARITLLVEGEKQGKGFINFVTDDGIFRFADFVTEEYDAEKDKWAGEPSEVYRALQESFDKNMWISLILVRVNSEKDLVKRTEAAEMG